MASGRGLSNTDMLRQRKALQAARKFGWLVKWLGYFPQEALSFLNRHHFESQRWHLLNLWLRVPRGRELFDALPSLAWMLSASWRYKLKPVQRPLRSLRTLVTKPRRHILRWLDLPEGEGTLRLLGQYQGKLMNKRIAHAMFLVLRHREKRRWWQNLPHPPDYRQLCLIAYDMPVSFDLLRAMNEAAAREPDGQQIGVEAAYRDTMRMLRQLNDPACLTQLGRIRSPDRLRRFHDKLVLMIHQQYPGGDQLAQRQFTIDSPLAVPPWLHPVRDYESLLREGFEMNHCADSYSDRIAGGAYYVYAVHHPLGRATLGIHRISGGGWELSQLQGPRNAPVPAPVQADVRAWLRHAVPPPHLQYEFDFLASCGPDDPEDADIPF